MKTYVGNIWNLLEEKYRVVIPVNIGWKGTGENVMGRGLAKEALKRYPGCNRWLGVNQRAIYKVLKEGQCKPDDPGIVKLWTMAYEDGPLIFMPSKPLNEAAPWFSWKNGASMKLIEKGLEEFPQFLTDNKVDKVAIPLMGAGNGGLDPAEIRKLIEKKLGSDDRVALVLPKELGKEEGWQT